MVRRAFSPGPATRMPALRHLTLTGAQRAELICLRDTAPKPYLRERAAALLKIAAGARPAHVARSGLLRPRKERTVYTSLRRYEEAGVAGLLLRPGRGRKPAFSPCAPGTLGGEARPPACDPARPAHLWL